jgi:SAM-dependent methyltransferase
MNGKKDLPPIYLRRHVGPLSSFEASGAEFMAYLRLICELLPNERVLDLGCGCGQLAIQLEDYLDRGASNYSGMDLHRASIRWCERYIANTHHNFTFQYMDVHSQAYNRRGRLAAHDYTFPYESGAFNFVIAKSVFTHLRPAEVDNYIKEIARVLAKGGRSLMTFFLLNVRQRELQTAGENKLDFRFGDSDWRYVRRNSPESAAAYDERFVMDLLQEHGLRLKRPIIYGRWTGNAEGLSLQDILLVEKDSRSEPLSE